MNLECVLQTLKKMFWAETSKNWFRNFYLARFEQTGLSSLILYIRFRGKLAKVTSAHLLKQSCLIDQTGNFLLGLESENFFSRDTNAQPHKLYTGTGGKFI